MFQIPLTVPKHEVTSYFWRCGLNHLKLVSYLARCPVSSRFIFTVTIAVPAAISETDVLPLLAAEADRQVRSLNWTQDAEYLCHASDVADLLTRR
jgi:hypothetical protein